MNRFALSAAAIAALAGGASAQLVITEFFYNPAGPEVPGEFVEIYNPTNAPVNINGWSLNDTQDGQLSGDITGGQDVFVQPLETLVVMRSTGDSRFRGSGSLRLGAPDGPLSELTILTDITPAVVEQAWGPEVAGKVFVTPSVGFLANSASPTNEFIELANFTRTENPAGGQDANTVDFINYENGNDASGGWPRTTELSGAGGQSVMLRPGLVDTLSNDFGPAWSPARPADLNNAASGVRLANRVSVPNLYIKPILDENGVQEFSRGELYYEPTTSDDPAAIAVYNEDGSPFALTLISGLDPNDPDNNNENYASPGVVDTSTPANLDCDGVSGFDIFQIAFTPGFTDCDSNGIMDQCEIVDNGGTSAGGPSNIAFAFGGTLDQDGNGVLDTCDIRQNPSVDCDFNGILDAVEIANDPSLDMNNDGRLDACGHNTIIITEIQHVPNTDPQLEFVELYNLTGSDIDVTGYQLTDLENFGNFDFPETTVPFPAGTIIPAGGTLVLVEPANELDIDEEGADETADAAALFADLYGTTNVNGQPIVVLPISGFESRSEFARGDNELLALVNASGFIVDYVNWFASDSSVQPQGGWPGDFRGSNGASNYLLTSALSSVDPAAANDDGANWGISYPGVDGAVQTAFEPTTAVTDVFEDTGEDVASPGYVPTVATGAPTGSIIITEIAAVTNGVSLDSPSRNPNDSGFEGAQDEYLEIYNTTGASIDVSGWYFQDEDGRTTGFPAGTTLGAGEVAAVIGVDSNLTDFDDNATPIANFRAAWGFGFPVILVGEWYENDGPFGLARLANSPAELNEVLRLYDAAGTLIDVVNYDDNAPANDLGWPLSGNATPDDDNFSYYLLNGNYNTTANDSGFNWAATDTGVAGLDGARFAVELLTDGVTTNPVWNGNRFAGTPGGLVGVSVFDAAATGALPFTGTCVLDGECVDVAEQAACELVGGTYLGDGSTCPGACGAADTDNNGTVNGLDFNAILNAFGTSAGDEGFDDAADTDGNDTINGLDFNAVLNAFGTSCP